MAQIVYLLCAITSFGCALLQLRTYLRNRTRFLLWTTICFGAFFANNALLFIDLMIGPVADLSVPRGIVLLCGLAVLLYGFIWETT